LEAVDNKSSSGLFIKKQLRAVYKSGSGLFIKKQLRAVYKKVAQGCL